MNEKSFSQSFETMSTIQKAALILKALGEGHASAILKQLDEDDQNQLNFWISQIDHIPPSNLEKCLKEFYPLVQLEKNLPTHLDVDTDKLTRPKDQRNGQLWHILHTAEIDKLVDFFKQQPSEAIALILSRINRKRAAAILQELSPEKQKDIVNAFASLPSLRPEELKILLNITAKLINQPVNQEDIPKDYVKVLIEIFRNLNPSTRTHLLSELQKTDIDLTNKLKAQLEKISL